MMGCKFARNSGSDSLLVQLFGFRSGCSDEPGFEQVEFSAAIHLPFHELELGDLALGLTVRPSMYERGVDSVSI